MALFWLISLGHGGDLMGAAYQYWRLWCFGKGSSNVRINTLELRVSLDGSGSNLALLANGAASASSFQSSNADFAFNANDADSWIAGASDSNPWLQFAFTAPNKYDINSLVISTGGGISAPTSIALEGSDDQSSWERRIFVGYLNTSSARQSYSVNWPIAVADGPGPMAVYGQGRPGGSLVFPAEPMFIDTTWGGSYQVAGTVAESGTPNTPLHRQVFLLRERGLKPIRSTWSDPLTGAYSFDNISGDYQYTVLSYDYARNYRAVVADNITPVPMP
jgi:hypothetical protein